MDGEESCIHFYRFKLDGRGDNALGNCSEDSGKHWMYKKKLIAYLTLFYVDNTRPLVADTILCRFENIFVFIYSDWRSFDAIASCLIDTTDELMINTNKQQATSNINNLAEHITR